MLGVTLRAETGNNHWEEEEDAKWSVTNIEVLNKFGKVWQSFDATREYARYQ